MPIFFSVIIPTYNRAISLKRALDSLVSQTYKDFEVIVCDDGSTDNTKEIISQYSSSLNLKYLWNENWGGPARPRNIGIKESSGKWISFLDSDDWWYSNKLEECSKFVADYDLIYHVVDIFNAVSGKSTGKRVGRILGQDTFKDLVLNGNGLANSSVLIKKTTCEEIGEISEAKSLVAVEDYDYWLRAAKAKNRFKFIDKSLGAYDWDGESNISQISMDRINKETTIFNQYVGTLSHLEQKQATHNFNYKLGRYYGLLGNNFLARKYLSDSIRSSKLSVRLKSILFYLKLTLKKG